MRGLVSMARRLLNLALAAVMVGSGTASAIIIVLDDPITEHVRDATLIESATGALSSGGDTNFFVGRTGQSAGLSIRRGLIQFDIAGNIPANSTINSVSLALTMTKTHSAASQTITLHKLLFDWGEGNVDSPSGGAVGGTAVNGDATWVHRFRPDNARRWGQLGGQAGVDYVNSPSASLSVSTTFGTKTWSSTPQLVADVQGWVDSNATNFGWFLKGNEATNPTAMAFTSSEGASTGRPRLTIDYTEPPPLRRVGDVNNDTKVDRLDLTLLLRHFGASGIAGGFDVGDFDADQKVGITDLSLMQNHLDPMPPPAAPEGGPVAVPEPSAAMLSAMGLLALVAMTMARRRKNARGQL